MRFFILLVIQLLVGCKSQVGFDFQIGLTREELRSVLPPIVEVRQLVGVYHDNIDYDSVNSYGAIDTILLFGPYKYSGVPAQLNARIRNNRVYQYDIIFTKIDHIIKSNRGLISEEMKKKHPDPKEPYWSEFVNRHYSSTSEFEYLKSILSKRYLKPDLIIGDTIVLWTKEGVVLNARNQFTTTIISFFDPSKGYENANEWQFYAIYQNPSYLNLNIDSIVSDQSNQHRSGKLIIKKEDSTIVQFGLKSWGIDGRVSVFLDSKNKPIYSIWQARKIGSQMAAPFMGIALYIDTFLLSNFPGHKQINVSSFSWWNDNEIISAVLDPSLENIYIRRQRIIK